jgi:hypothetical protein
LCELPLGDHFHFIGDDFGIRLFHDLADALRWRRCRLALLLLFSAFCGSPQEFFDVSSHCNPALSGQFRFFG